MKKYYTLVLCALITACGGGGGGGSSSGGGSTGPVASELTFQFKAITDAERTQNSYITGTISGRSVTTPVVTFGGTYTANTVYSANNVFSYKPLNSSTVTNVNASASATSSTFVFNNFSNGSNPVSDNATNTSYYDTAGKLLGAISSSGSTDLTTSGGTVPVSGKVGAQGQLYTQDILYTSFGGVSLKCGTETATYSVEPDTATTVIVKQVITRSITVSNCGSSTTATGYTRFTQTSSKDLYIDLTTDTLSMRITIN